MVATTAPSPTKSGPANRTLRILYADDMKELRDVAQISLSRDGHRIECVDDGRAALNCLAARPDDFDLLITDHHMPNVNGLELVSQLRTGDFRGKILIFSSELSTDVAESYRHLSVDRILYKPVFPSELRRVLGEMFPPAAVAA